MKQNVGPLDAYVRLTLGLTMLGLGTIYKSRSMVLIGSMETASGITGWCPLLDVMGVSTNKKQDSKITEEWRDFPYPTPS